MKRRKIMALALAAALTLGMLAGCCSGSGSNAGGSGKDPLATAVNQKLAELGLGNVTYEGQSQELTAGLGTYIDNLNSSSDDDAARTKKIHFAYTKAKGEDTFDLEYVGSVKAKNFDLKDGPFCAAVRVKQSKTVSSSTSCRDENIISDVENAFEDSESLMRQGQYGTDDKKDLYAGKAGIYVFLYVVPTDVEYDEVVKAAVTWILNGLPHSEYDTETNFVAIAKDSGMSYALSFSDEKTIEDTDLKSKAKIIAGAITVSTAK